MGAKLNLIGETFGRLTVLRQVESLNKQTRWLCRCECSKEKEVRGSHLTSGKIISCGCFNEEKKFKHGLSEKRLYKTHHGMIRRCYNKPDNRYENYGGRGIQVCDEWQGKKGLENFYNWAMQNGYNDDLTIDRIDVDGNYEPSNCKWATREEQDANKTNTFYITIDGETKSISTWAKENGLTRSTIKSRVNLGWEGKDLIKPPTRPGSRPKKGG